MDTNGARASTAPGAQEPSPAEALHRLQQQIEELRAYFTHFVSAKVDSFVLSGRQLAIWSALGVLGLTALLGLIITAIVLLLDGIATGLGLLFGGRLWLGQIVVGGGLLILLTLTILIGVRTWQHRSRQQKVQQYDERQLQQRAAFGHSVADRATEDRALQHER
jgi:membrane protein implicated in regulation of membrane protease activity